MEIKIFFVLAQQWTNIKTAQLKAKV